MTDLKALYSLLQEWLVNNHGSILATGDFRAQKALEQVIEAVQCLHAATINLNGQTLVPDDYND